MEELGIAIGLIFVIEGLLWALCPHFIITAFETASKMPEIYLRLGGTVAVSLGVFIVWIIRG